MNLSEELEARGFVYQFSTEKLEEIFDSGKNRTVYLGIDPTADSMHVGHLVPYMMLNHIMRAGHNVIFVMGGGTALIGDPSFKDSERDIAGVEEISEQCKELEANIRKLTTSNKIKFVNNYDWLSKLKAIEFMRDVGKHFTINAMIKRESVSARLKSEQGISYTEFSYGLLQAYDFYHLHKEFECDVQIGGSDQWGNIIAGVDYIRRITGDTVYALTLPLVTEKSTGKKFGKSEGNAIWLDLEKTSPYEFYQFWLNTSDESVIDYLKLFTFVSLEEINSIQKEFKENPESRSAQKKLAEEVTIFVHGKETMLLVQEVADILFGEEEFKNISVSGKKVLLENTPTTKVNLGESIIDVLVNSKLASSKRESRTLVEAGAITLSGIKIDNIETELTPDFFIAKIALLRRGKKHISVLVLK